MLGEGELYPPPRVRCICGSKSASSAGESEKVRGDERGERSGCPKGEENIPKRGGTAEMTPVTRQEVLSLYRKVFQIAKTWQSASGQMKETEKEKQYIISEAKTLFRKNRNLTDPELIKQCVEECKARIELGLHYRNPYPRPIHLPPMGLALPQARAFRHQEKLRKISKPVYLKSHDEIS